MSTNSNALANSRRLFWGGVIFIAILALLSRFLDLGAKPFHHDESLHAYYSHIIATGGVRDYDPLLHGPFLYYFVGLVQFIASFIGLGASDFVARAPAALFGVLLVLSPLTIKKHIGNIATISIMLIFLISPTFMYFSRFLREDIFTSIWVTGAVFGYLNAFMASDSDSRLSFTILQKPITFSSKTLWAAFAIAMLAFHFTNKENSFLHTAMAILAVACISLFNKIFHKNATPLIIANDFQKKLRWLILPIVFFGIFILFFSSFFRHSQGWYTGVLDGLYRKSLVYWWGQDQVRRIDGPFDYYLPIIVNYEFLLLPLLITAWYRQLWESINKKYFYVVLAACVSLVLVTFFLPRLPLVSDACSIADISCQSLSKSPLSCKVDTGKPWACYLHLTHSRHVLQIISYIVLFGMAFFAAMHKQKTLNAFLWFWLTGAIGIYSYVGEKVPWLIVYVLLPLVFIAGLEVSSVFAMPRSYAKKIIIAWLVCAVPFTLYKAIDVSFFNAANPQERLVFTQTDYAIKEIIDRINAAAAYTPTHNIRIAISGESTWPIAWYAQKYTGFDFFTQPDNKVVADNILKKPEFDVIFINDSNVAEISRRFLNYNIYNMPLRSWWVPKPNPTVPEMLAYFFKKQIYPFDYVANKPKPDAGLGSTRVLYLEKNNSAFANTPPLKLATLVRAAVVK